MYSEGLIYGGGLRFKIDRASLIVGSKFTVLALFYVVFEGNFPSTSPLGWGLYLEGRFNGGLFAYIFCKLCKFLISSNKRPSSGKRRGSNKGGLLIRETLINFSFQKRYFYFD